MEQLQPIEGTDSLVDIKKFFLRVLRRWHWVALSIGTAWFIAFLINRYETPVYRSSASIITKKFQEGGGGDGLATQRPFGLPDALERYMQVESFEQLLVDIKI